MGPREDEINLGLWSVTFIPMDEAGNRVGERSFIVEKEYLVAAVEDLLTREGVASIKVLTDQAGAEPNRRHWHRPSE